MFSNLNIFVTDNTLKMCNKMYMVYQMGLRAHFHSRGSGERRDEKSMRGWNT